MIENEKQYIKGGRFKDLTGIQFGRLIAIKTIGLDNNKGYIWECKCECGTICQVRSHDLVRGATKSCGCLHRETIVGNKFATIHGQYGTDLFNTWRHIKERCLLTYNKNYNHYGGRGITICNEWKENYFVFKDWSINNGYSKGLSIDRINNDGNYEPNNCRWTTMKVQGNNRSTNIFVTYQDKTQTLSQWSEEKGINKGTLYGRFRKGWKDEKLFSEPDKRFSHHTKRKIND